MADISTFESRPGKLVCSSDDAFNFTSDIRNFKQFIPADSVNVLTIEKDYCRFNVNMLGDVKIQISEKVRPFKVAFSGQIPQIKNLLISLNYCDTGNSTSDIRIVIRAEINPFLKMMVAEPVNNFLEKLVIEMEKFRGWKEII